MGMNELAAKVRELKELKTMAEEIAADIAAIEDDIKAFLTANDTDELTVDVFKIRWKEVISNRFDSKAFEREMPDLHARYIKQSKCRRFTVS